MSKRFSVIIVITTSIFLTAGIAKAAGLTADWLRVGSQGTGGVTYFNGTIINNTTGTGGIDNPVTFGDNVRIDGRIYRGATAGTSDAWPFIVNDNMEVAGSLTIGSLANTGVVTSSNIADGTLTASDLADNTITSAKINDGTITSSDLADSAVTSAKINNGTIIEADLADSAVTSAKISNGAISEADLADDSVTPIKINGTAGANLPIAYGYCDENGNTIGGTSNVTCSWNPASGGYIITIQGENYFYNQYITVVTAVINDYYANVGGNSGKLNVWFTSAAGLGGLQTDFAFITYKIE